MKKKSTSELKHAAPKTDKTSSGRVGRDAEESVVSRVPKKKLKLKLDLDTGQAPTATARIVKDTSSGYVRRAVSPHIKRSVETHGNGATLKHTRSDGERPTKPVRNATSERSISRGRDGGLKAGRKGREMVVDGGGGKALKGGEAKGGKTVKREKQEKTQRMTGRVGGGAASSSFTEDFHAVATAHKPSGRVARAADAAKEPTRVKRRKATAETVPRERLARSPPPPSMRRRVARGGSHEDGVSDDAESYMAAHAGAMVDLHPNDDDRHARRPQARPPVKTGRRKIELDLSGATHRRESVSPVRDEPRTTSPLRSEVSVRSLSRSPPPPRSTREEVRSPKPRPSHRAQLLEQRHQVRKGRIAAQPVDAANVSRSHSILRAAMESLHLDIHDGDSVRVREGWEVSKGGGGSDEEGGTVRDRSYLGRSGDGGRKRGVKGERHTETDTHTHSGGGRGGMRDSVRDVLAESSEGIMQESLHLVVLLRRAMGEVSEKEAQVREFRDRAEVAEKRLSAASESANKWKEEAEASTLARSEALQRLEDEEARRCQAEHDHSQAAAKLEVAMNWARAEEEKRVEAEARVKHLEQSLDAAMTQQQELQATLHDKDLAVQKLCLEQEGLDNKCAELVKEVQSYSLQLEAKQKEVLRLQTYIQQVEAEIDEYKALLSKNEKRTILLLDQLKRLSEENVNLVRRASELGREDGPESSNRSRRFVTSHLKAGATQDVNTRPGRVTVLESELIKAEARSNELEGRLQQEVKHRGAAEQKYQEMALSLEAVQARLKQSEEIAHARDQAMKAMHLALNQSRSNQETHTHNTPTRPPYPHHHTTRDPFLDSTASAPPSTSLPPPPVRQNRPPSAATKYFSILSDPPFARSV